MGIFLGSLFIDFWVSVAIAAVTFFFFRRKLKGWKRILIGSVSICFFAGVCFILLFMPLSRLLWNSTVTKGENVSLSEYHGIGPKLPPGVRDITYHSCYGGTEAMFSINKNDFITWVDIEGWKRKTAKKAQVDLYYLDVTCDVRDAIAVDETFHPRGTGVHIVFDCAKNKCYFRYASY